MTIKNKTRKIIATFLIILIIMPAVLFFGPKQTQAQIPGLPQPVIVVAPIPPSPVMESGPWGTIMHILTGTTSASTVTNTAISIKNVALEILRQAVMVIERKLLQQMTQATVNWINSGFHGAPLFLENPGSFFQDIAKTEVKTLVNEFGYDPNKFPFGKDFALNTINSYKRQLADNAQYTLSKVMADPVLLHNYQNNFNVGGWNGFLINTQYPQNNYLGFQMLATDQLARQLQGTTQNAAQKVQTTLQQGMGFLSPQTCPSNPNYNNGTNEFQKPSFDMTKYEKDHPYDTGSAPGVENCTSCTGAQQVAMDAYREKWNRDLANAKGVWEMTNTCPDGLVATTPGSVVANQITTAMSSTFRQSELAAALGNSISAILDTLLNHFLDKGLTALGGLVNSAPSVDNWSYDGNTFNGSTVPGDLVIPQNVSVNVGEVTSTTISGGTASYSIQTGPNTGVANAQISGTTLTVTGIAPGQTSFVVKDSSSPTKTVTVSVTVSAQGALKVIPLNVSTVVNTPITVTIQGGVKPYSVTDPDTKIAGVVYSENDNTIVVVGMAPGNTSFVVKDSSSPAKTVTVPIEIIDNTPNTLITSKSVSVDAGNTTSITISGGAAPYFIYSQPDSNVAIADISGDVLTITGVAPGQTGIVITDSSPVKQIATIDVTVTGSGNVSGTCTLFNGTITNNVTQSDCQNISGMWTP